MTTIREELRGRCDHRVTDAEIDAALRHASCVLDAEVDPESDTVTLAEDDPLWCVIDAAWQQLQPRTLVVVTDRTILEGAMFDPGGLARFFVEHAADDLRAECWIVVDRCRNDGTDVRPLIRFAERYGIRVAGVPLTRSSGQDNYRHTLDRLTERQYQHIVIGDTHYRSDDPRVTIYRRVQR